MNWKRGSALVEHVPFNRAGQQPPGVAVQRGEIQPGLCDHAAEGFKGGHTHAVAGLPQGSAEGHKGLDVSTRAEGENGDAHRVNRG